MGATARAVTIGLALAGCEAAPPPPVTVSSSTGAPATCDAVVTDYQMGADATVYVDWLVTEVRDAAGLLVLETIEDGLVPSAGMGWRTTYDAVGQPAFLEYLDWQGAVFDEITWTYSYDAAGRLATTHMLSTDGTEVFDTFVYDALDRVAEVHSDGQQAPGIDGVIDQVEHFAYDPAGWLATREVTAPAVVGWSWVRTYESRGLLTSVVEYEDLEAVDIEEWAYDAVGNVARYERDSGADGELDVVWTYTWTYDAQDLPLLQQIDQDDDGDPDSEVAYTYDAAGLLVAMAATDVELGSGWQSWAISRSSVTCP